MDNPHTKPVWFWEWLIAEVNNKHPEVVFLAEAFTRPADDARAGPCRFPAVLHLLHLAQHQDGARGVLHRGQPRIRRRYFRPNFFVNTPDILTEYLQYGGPAAFKIRAVLAATASPLWGVYAGYELYEHVARPGAEEYIDNEKFEYKARDWDGAAASGRTLAPFITRLNHHPAGPPGPGGPAEPDASTTAPTTPRWSSPSTRPCRTEPRTPSSSW